MSKPLESIDSAPVRVESTASTVLPALESPPISEDDSIRRSKNSADSASVEWTEMFRILAEGANAAVETKLEKSLAFAKRLAYFYWVLIATVGFFGATKMI